MVFNFINTNLHSIAQAYLQHHTCFESFYSLAVHKSVALLAYCSLSSAILIARLPFYLFQEFGYTKHSKVVQLSNQNQTTSYPIFGFNYIHPRLHIRSDFFSHLMPDNGFLGKRFSLRAILISGRFISE